MNLRWRKKRKKKKEKMVRRWGGGKFAGVLKGVEEWRGGGYDFDGVGAFLNSLVVRLGGGTGWQFVPR